MLTTCCDAALEPPLLVWFEFVVFEDVKYWNSNSSENLFREMYFDWLS